MVARKHLPALMESVAGCGPPEWQIACGASRLRSPENGAIGGALHHESATPRRGIRFDESAQGTLRSRRRRCVPNSKKGTAMTAESARGNAAVIVVRDVHVRGDAR
jgi:hypothetical protein